MNAYTICLAFQDAERDFIETFGEDPFPEDEVMYVTNVNSNPFDEIPEDWVRSDADEILEDVEAADENYYDEDDYDEDDYDEDDYDEDDYDEDDYDEDDYDEDDSQLRKCNCGSGDVWSECNRNTAYCG